MKVSFIVPAFNEEKLIAETLRAIRGAASALTDRGWEWELIVCDNNSTDQTAAIARQEGAWVVFEPVNQISRARNCGAAAATGEWLVFVDADSLPSAGLLAELATAVERTDCVGGRATLVLEDAPPWARRMVGCWNLLSRLCRWAAGSFIYCERNAFVELGGFSQELFVSEEIDFSRRLKRLARRRHRRVVILAGHPLVTSSRKLRLYSPRDYWRLLWRAVWTRGGAYRDRSACSPWYDGRR